MTNRVVFGAFAGTNVLRISRPGFDVLDDTLPAESIAFDSRWSSTANIIQMGMIDFGGANWVNIQVMTTPPFALLVRRYNSSWVHLPQIGVYSYLDQPNPQVTISKFESSARYAKYVVFKGIDG